jgi:hypothetical protein
MRDPRISQDLSTVFPPASSRLSGAWPASSGTAVNNTQVPNKQMTNLESMRLGDPFVEADTWCEAEEEPPIMLVRGTKRATLQKSQATAVATAVAKGQYGGKGKKKDKSGCKSQ